MKIVISIYKTNPDDSNSLYTMSDDMGIAPNWLRHEPYFKHYGWKHEFPDEDKLKEALNIIWEATKNG